jgi:hypothetical protein
MAPIKWGVQAKKQAVTLQSASDFISGNNPASSVYSCCMCILYLQWTIVHCAAAASLQYCATCKAIVFLLMISSLRLALIHCLNNAVPSVCALSLEAQKRDDSGVCVAVVARHVQRNVAHILHFVQLRRVVYFDAFAVSYTFQRLHSWLFCSATKVYVFAIDKPAIQSSVCDELSVSSNDDRPHQHRSDVCSYYKLIAARSHA